MQIEAALFYFYERTKKSIFVLSKKSFPIVNEIFL